MVGVGAVVPDWVGGVDLDAEDALMRKCVSVMFRVMGWRLAYGAQITTVDGGIAGGLARGVESSRSNRVGAGEVEFDDIAHSSSHALGAESIARSDLDGEGVGEDAGGEGNRSDEVCELDHFDGN